ncbi:hypothetical protein [Aureispira sp. CCB-QB1]|uniref:hypothetical protein n=1 Tax=Aureispira sp. CCB-QB1 TaxID=1313421 RepID=UPI0006978483|nr:hypothetical protein [Aureispira sp. CCB-QB1]
MFEFNNRISAQREIIQLINGTTQLKTSIFGLSSKAIQRWTIENQLDSSSELVKIITEISGKLFFLANKSQEQISESYKNLSVEISSFVTKLKEELKKYSEKQ